MKDSVKAKEQIGFILNGKPVEPGKQPPEPPKPNPAPQQPK